MKTLLLPLVCALSLAGTFPVQAQTEPAREFKQLQTDREKALAAAAVPINQRYIAALEQVLRRATLANDLDTAVKVREELLKLGVTVSAVGTASGLGGTDEGKRAALKAQLRDTTWQLDGGKSFTLHADGTTSASWHTKKGVWKVTAPNTAEMSITNAGNLKKATFDAGVTTASFGDETARKAQP